MELPKIVEKKSKTVQLMPGVYYYCRCGLSKDQPFCDGAHEGSEFLPKKFRIDEPKNVYACMCKHTKSAPYCDGSHNKL